MNSLFDTKQALMEFAIVCLAEYDKRSILRQPRGKRKDVDLITQREAYAEFGEAWIKKAVSDCLLHGHKKSDAKNSTVRFSRAEIYALLAAERINGAGVKIK
jgi:hypothetical protein